MPKHVVRKITSYMLVDEKEQNDGIGWRNEPSSIISVSSAYNIIHEHVGMDEDATWANIWKAESS